MSVEGHPLDGVVDEESRAEKGVSEEGAGYAHVLEVIEVDSGVLEKLDRAGNRRLLQKVETEIELPGADRAGEVAFRV